MTSPQVQRLDAAGAPPTSDIQNDTDNDPQKLLKLSHSLRYQLAQPVRRQPVQDALPGMLRNSQQLPTQLPPIAGRDQYVHTAQQPPPLKGTGTESGPYQGFASKAWLQGEFKQELEEMRQHVDEYVTKREHRAFELERAAFKAEISHLRKRLEEEQEKVRKLELMLPDEDGEFKSLKAELRELDEEADRFCDLYEREAKATSQALEGFRRAIADVNYIETEFDRIRHIINSIPQPAPSTMPYAYGLPPGLPGAPGMPPFGDLQPSGGADEVADSDTKVCCGCFRITRRRRANADVPQTGLMNGGMQGMPSGAVQGMPSGAMQGMPSGAMQGMPSGAMQGMPGGAMQGMPGGAMQGMPGGAMQGMPSGAVQGMPSGAMQGMPGGAMQGMPGGAMQGMPGGAMQGMPSGAMQGMPGGAMQGMPGGAMQGMPGGAMLAETPFGMPGVMLGPYGGEQGGGPFAGRTR